MFNIYLLLGSNLGDRHSYLQHAIAAIEQGVGAIVKQSSVYETAAWGKTTEPDYLNQVIEVKTDLLPQEVLKIILQIESDLGRKREEKWGSRTIDIDILFYEDTIINEVNLTVPHPELYNRRFTLEPMSEIAPDFIHPVLKKRIWQLKNDLQDCLIIKKL